jgi:hypothetical protein
MKGTSRKPGAPVHIISGRERLLLPRGDFSQQCPVRKLHAVVLPPSPHPLPPKRGCGEGVNDVAGFNNHKVLNRFHFSPSPPMGERVGVRGK